MAVLTITLITRYLKVSEELCSRRLNDPVPRVVNLDVTALLALVTHAYKVHTHIHTHTHIVRDCV